jgi:hypothetical protein
MKSLPALRLQHDYVHREIVYSRKKRNILAMRINRAIGLIIMLIALKFMFVDTLTAFGTASATAFRTAESVLLVAKDTADEQRR